MRAALPSFALVLVACGGAPDDATRVYHEGFESLCDEVPCSWEQGAGPDGGAVWIEALPGEHAVSVQGPDTIVLGPRGFETPAPMELGTMELRVAARCDPGASIELRVWFVVLPPDGTVPGEARTESARVRFDAASIWSGVPATVPFILEGAAEPFFDATRRIERVALRVDGRGRCEVADFAVHAFPTGGFFTD